MMVRTDNLKEAYSTAHLTLAELTQLLTMTGAKIGPGSPVRKLAADPQPSDGPEVVGALQAKGICSTDQPSMVPVDLARAIKSLADPRWSIQLWMGNFNEVSATAFYGSDDPPGRSLVGFKGAPESGFGISYFLSKEHVPALLEPYLQLSMVTVSAPFQFRLTYEEYLVLLAVVDAYRHAHLQAFLDRKRLDQWTVSEADINLALHKGFTSPDTRWLVTVGQIISPSSFGWSSKSIGIGIDRLAEKGVILPMPEPPLPVYSLSRELETFCRTMVGLLGFSTVQVDEIRPDGKKGVFYANILRAPTSAWIARFSNLSSVPPEVTVFSVDGSYLRQALDELFHRGGEHEAAWRKYAPMASPAEKGKPLKAVCPSCEAQIDIGMRFCGYCGKPMPAGEERNQPEKARFCTNCGTAVKLGMQSCANCGAPMKERRRPKPQLQPEPAAPVCRACSSPLAPGKKFCTKCGTPVIPKENG